MNQPLNPAWEMLGIMIRIAAAGHEGEFDKGGYPYILHPLHLMNQCNGDPILMAICVGHDILEDTDHNDRSLSYEFRSDAIVHHCFKTYVLPRLILMNHDKKRVPYADYIVGLANDWYANQAKQFDLDHNSRITRLKGIEQKDQERILKYHKSFLYLKDIFKNLPAPPPVEFLTFEEN